MAERSFKEEVKQLKIGAGEEFKGEAILAVTKALLQSGVSYVSGYQGAPISHLIDVLNDANEMLQELGVRFEAAANEASAAAALAASISYPLRGACTFKATVGLNVASDAIAALSSGGVKGGALIIIGEDYGEGSSINQERSHAFAMKSQFWLLDPRPNVQTIVDMVEKGFQLSEASNTPVMLQLRIRACHVYGSFIAKDNKKPEFSRLDALNHPARDVTRYALPPYTYIHEQEKIEQRWPAAIKFIKENKINEFFDGDAKDIGIVMQGGLYNSVLRAMEIVGLADVYGNSRIPLYVLNVAYPLVDDEFTQFCAGKKAIMLVEEGQPEFIEHAVNTILRRADIQTRVEGKSVLPMAGEYTGTVLKAALEKFCKSHRPDILPPEQAKQTNKSLPVALERLGQNVQGRQPSFCTGCPERPIFAAMKLVQREIGTLHISNDVGCHTFAALEPFNLGNTTVGYGLGGAGASPLSGQGGKRPVAVVGDGGFWHSGLVSSVGHQVFNKTDSLTLIVDNGYAAATGGQDVLSSAGNLETRSTQHPIEKAVRGVGAEWVTHLKNTYDVAGMRDALRDALTTKIAGPKVIIASSECMLNKQRREKPLVREAVKRGERVVRERFGVDADTCTGDHSCIRLSGCPSLTIAPNPDPLRREPITKVVNSCVGCGLCGEVAHAAVLCPSFYQASIIDNPTKWDHFKQRVRGAVIGYLQRRLDRKMVTV
jgi:indolepyruvate ferredoxin oxidoreductase alpha subunit